MKYRIIKLEIPLLDLQKFNTSDLSEVLDTFDELKTDTHIVSFGEELNRAVVGIVLKNEQFPEIESGQIIPTYYISECNKCLDLYCSYFKHECVLDTRIESGSNLTMDLIKVEEDLFMVTRQYWSDYKKEFDKTIIDSIIYGTGSMKMGYEEEQDSFEDWSVYGFPTPKTFPKECDHEWKEIELFTSKVIECTKCHKEKE